MVNYSELNDVERLAVFIDATVKARGIVPRDLASKNDIGRNYDEELVITGKSFITLIENNDDLFNAAISNLRQNKKDFFESLPPEEASAVFIQSLLDTEKAKINGELKNEHKTSQKVIDFRRNRQIEILSDINEFDKSLTAFVDNKKELENMKSQDEARLR